MDVTLESAHRGRIAQLFARLSPRYDLFNHVASFGLDPWWRRRTVQLARIVPTDRILDMAAGTGDLTLALARRSPACVASTDLVPEMLVRGREKLANARLTVPVSFEAVDACALPFADGSFTVATVAFGVRNFANRAAHFREVHRVLRPGGRYLILEFSPPPRGIFRPFYSFYLEHVLTRFGAWLTGDLSAFQHLNRSIRGFPEPHALVDELRGAGFEEVRWTSLTLGVVTIHQGRRAA